MGDSGPGIVGVVRDQGIGDVAVVVVGEGGGPIGGNLVLAIVGAAGSRAIGAATRLLDQLRDGWGK